MAGSAGVHKAADTGRLSHMELLDRVPYRRDRANNFVAGHHGKNRIAPFVTGLMNIRMTDAAIGDRDEHVMRSHISSLKYEGLQGSLGEHRGISLGRQHSVNSL